MYEKNALNNLKDVLGKYCAINQFVELSKRCFVVELRCTPKSRVIKKMIYYK